MELKLKEKIVLLYLNDQSGGREKGGYHFEIGLSACILMDMLLEDLILIKEGKLHLQSIRHPQDPVYRDIVKLMQKKKKDRSLKVWVGELNMKANRYKKEIIKTLVTSRILRKEYHRFLGIPYHRYPTLNPNPENQFRQELIDKLKHSELLTQSDAAFLSILKATKSLSVLIKDKEDRKRITAELEKLAKDNAFGEAVNEVIKQVTAVLMTVVITSAAVH